MEGQKNSPAKIAANNRYAARNYDRINLAIRKGTKERIQKQIAGQPGQSVNRFITDLVLTELDRLENGS